MWHELVSPDILWSVNKLARAVIKWTRACDKRFARLISYIHHTSDCRPYCHVGHTGGISCIFGSRTFVPISWMCKKQTSVSHGSTESEIISLDAGIRMDGLLALDYWDVVIELLRSSNSTKTPTNPAAGNCSRNHKSNPKQKGNRDVEQLSNVDYVHTNTHSSQGESQLYICEDNEAVIIMIIKGQKSNNETRVNNPLSCA